MACESALTLRAPLAVEMASKITQAPDPRQRHDVRLGTRPAAYPGVSWLKTLTREPSAVRRQSELTIHVIGSAPSVARKRTR